MTKLAGTVTTVGVHEAKTHLSRILRLVESGVEVHITRGNEPVARILPMGGVREPGFAAGTFVVPDDFDAPVPELTDGFYP